MLAASRPNHMPARVRRARRSGAHSAGARAVRRRQPTRRSWSLRGTEQSVPSMLSPDCTYIVQDRVGRVSHVYGSWFLTITLLIRHWSLFVHFCSLSRRRVEGERSQRRRARCNHVSITYCSSFARTHKWMGEGEGVLSDPSPAQACLLFILPVRTARWARPSRYSELGGSGPGCWWRRGSSSAPAIWRTGLATPVRSGRAQTALADRPGPAKDGSSTNVSTRHPPWSHV